MSNCSSKEDGAACSNIAESVSRLREFSMDALARMYCPSERFFVFRLRRAGEEVIPEGLSRRYTAITTIGLAGEEPDVWHKVLGDHCLATLCDRLLDDVREVTNLGDVALSLWAAKVAGCLNTDVAEARLCELVVMHDSPPVVEASWALDALCLAGKQHAKLRDQVASQLLAAFNHGAGIFPRYLNQKGGGLRSHVSCFADAVYPIHALSNYYKASGNEEALDAAARCAQRICELQGEAGQWWWHYDVRTGDVVEKYPVYSVHQDAMAPMALFALKDAGGPDWERKIAKGMAWLEFADEVGFSMVDEAAGVIWRKVARKGPNKIGRYLQAGASRIHSSLRAPGVDLFFPPVTIDYECRPYHLGWLLYAWPEHRAQAWDRGGRTI